jgi:hypothetical protein
VRDDHADVARADARVGPATPEDSVSGYATQGEFVRLGLSWESSPERDRVRPRSALGLWAGPRSQVTRSGRESGTASYETRFPALGAATLGRRVENLVYGASWQMAGSGGAEDVPAQYLDSNGWVKSLPAGYRVIRALSIPIAGGSFICRFQGNGQLQVAGPSVTNLSMGSGQSTFTITAGYPDAPQNYIQYNVDPTNYIRGNWGLDTVWADGKLYKGYVDIQNDKNLDAGAKNKALDDYRRANASPEGKQWIALKDQIDKETDATKQLALYKEMAKLRVDSAAYIPLNFAKAFRVVKPHIKGYEMNPFLIGYPMYFRSIWSSK